MVWPARRPASSATVRIWTCFAVVIRDIAAVTARAASGAAFQAMTIVSGESSAIREEITGTLQRGVTIYRGYGGLTNAEQDILYCVVTRLEIGKVKSIVRSIDQHAFIVSHALADVDGGVVKRTPLP